MDAVDGYAARAMGQSSQFGALLDMLTDRCATAALVMVLAVLYPSWMFAWQAVLVIDFASHYAHMYAHLAGGASAGDSHKTIDASQVPLGHAGGARTPAMPAADNRVGYCVCIITTVLFCLRSVPPTRDSFSPCTWCAPNSGVRAEQSLPRIALAARYPSRTVSR